MNKILPIILVVVLSGCSSISISAKKIKFINTPVLNDIKTVNIGDEVASAGQRSVNKGIIIEGKIYKPYSWLWGFKSEQQTALLRFKRDNDDCYGPFSGIRLMDFDREAFSGEDMNICIRENSINKKLYLYFYDGERSMEQGDIDNKYKIVSEMLDKNLDGKIFKKFVYGGKVNNLIKFYYREFLFSTESLSLQQDVQYNLDDSNIINYKELKLKIIKATNDSITYKVIENFKAKAIQ